MNAEVHTFSKALLELGMEESCLSILGKDAKFSLGVFKKHPEFLKIFRSSFLTQTEKDSALDEVFEKNVSELFLNFLKVLNSKKLFFLITKIIENFIEELNLLNNILTGVVFSTHSLTKIELKKLEDFVAKHLNKKILLKNTIDSKLISGIKIAVGDFIFEDNVKSQLEQMKNIVLKGGK